MKWIRFRFHANFDDSRPILWPPLGPTWETVLAVDESHATRVAYFPKEQSHRLKEFWPEADQITFTEEDKIVFTERFPCPAWWDQEMEHVFFQPPKEDP